MTYGKYNLAVKYINRVTGIEGVPYSLEIIVKSPWYLSTVAEILYLLLFIAIIGFGIYSSLRRQKKKQEEKTRRKDDAARTSPPRGRL